MACFATTPVIKYQPVQLESHASDSAMTGPAVAAEDHAIVDFDGDGILDALVRDHGRQLRCLAGLAR